MTTGQARPRDPQRIFTSSTRKSTTIIATMPAHERHRGPTLPMTPIRRHRFDDNERSGSAPVPSDRHRCPLPGGRRPVRHLRRHAAERGSAPAGGANRRSQPSDRCPAGWSTSAPGGHGGPGAGPSAGPSRTRPPPAPGPSPGRGPLGQRSGAGLSADGAPSGRVRRPGVWAGGPQPQQCHGGGDGTRRCVPARHRRRRIGGGSAAADRGPAAPGAAPGGGALVGCRN